MGFEIGQGILLSTQSWPQPLWVWGFTCHSFSSLLWVRSDPRQATISSYLCLLTLGCLPFHCHLSAFWDHPLAHLRDRTVLVPIQTAGESVPVDKQVPTQGNWGRCPCPQTWESYLIFTWRLVFLTPGSWDQSRSNAHWTQRSRDTAGYHQESHSAL